MPRSGWRGGAKLGSSRTLGNTRFADEREPVGNGDRGALSRRFRFIHHDHASPQLPGDGHHEAAFARRRTIARTHAGGDAHIRFIPQTPNPIVDERRAVDVGQAGIPVPRARVAVLAGHQLFLGPAADPKHRTSRFVVGAEPMARVIVDPPRGAVGKRQRQLEPFRMERAPTSTVEGAASRGAFLRRARGARRR